VAARNPPLGARQIRRPEATHGCLAGGAGGCAVPHHGLKIILWRHVGDLLVFGRQILGGSGGAGGSAQVVPHNSSTSTTTVFRPRVELSVHVAPAGEHGHAHEEQEHLLELEVLEVEGVGEHHEEQADENQVEHEPGDQESTPPGAQPMRRQAVTG
jgi:hypothetical protein